ncbi:MAG: peptidoglycan-binding protein [Anaerolineales bacterium]
MPTTRSGLNPAVIINKNTGAEVSCMFNPYEYTLSKQNRYGRDSTKGKNIPDIVFQQGGVQTLGLKLFFDTYGVGSAGGPSDVRDHTAPLWKMMMVDENKVDQKTGKSEPPHCIFRWGRFEFEAVITKMTEKITLFASDGTPVRSAVDITFQQIVDEEEHEGQNPTSGGGVAPKTRILCAGDRLDLIAWEEYGDSTKWRLVAERNGILDPLCLPIGKVISIPPLD